MHRGADLNCFDGFSMTPMMLATKNEHIKVHIIMIIIIIVAQLTRRSQVPTGF